MMTIDSSPSAWLNRIYLDLGDFKGGSPHHYKIEFSYNHLVNETSVPYRVQIFNSEFFREFLIRETGLYQYHVENPLQLAPQLRTERWQILCEHLSHYPELSQSNQVRVIELLNSLCFRKAILEYVQPISAAEIAQNENLATLAFSRAVSNLSIHTDRNLPYDLKEIEVIARNAPVGGNLVRIKAGMRMVIESAKTFKDIAGAEYWREFVTHEIEAIKPSLDDFTYGFLMSVYYRAVSFVPLLHRNKEQVVAEMDLSQSYAESLKSRTQEQEIISYENENTILESRTKEALWLGDLDLAEERACKLTQRDPLDPRYWNEVGEVLLKQGRIEEAAQAYRCASRLGPPCASVACFMAGQCYQSLGEIELACDYYLSCLRYDPLSISAVKRLSQIAADLGNEKLEEWCQLRLPQLEQQKQEMLTMGKTLSSYKL
jgi:tetratricopeptide (TPR) repeat protein